jgi:hypothetical protein
MDKKTQKPRAKIPNANSKQAGQMKKLPAAPSPLAMGNQQ